MAQSSDIQYPNPKKKSHTKTDYSCGSSDIHIVIGRLPGSQRTLVALRKREKHAQKTARWLWWDLDHWTMGYLEGLGVTMYHVKM